MQFIDFKKKHFTKNDDTGDYFIEISKDEVGYGELKVQEKKNDDTYADFDFETIDSLDKVTIKTAEPHDIRVHF